MINIAEMVLSEGKIVKNRDVLSPHYVPNMLLFREEQISTIVRAISPMFKGERGKNVFIYGKTGTGKTTVVRYIFSQIEKIEGSPELFYINARVYSSRYKIMQKIVSYFYPEMGKAGYGINHFYEKFLSLLKEGKRLLIAIDEIDFVDELDDLLYTLIRSNDEAKEGFASVIGISNKINFKERLDPRTKSSLQEEEVMFPPYNVTQLFEILKQRAELAFREGSFSLDVIRRIAVKAADETGDARYALKLLSLSADVAESKGKYKIDSEDVEEAFKKVEYDMTAEAMASLIPQQKILVYSLAKMLKERKTLSEEEGYVMSGELYEYYKKVVRKFGLSPKSHKWVRKWIKDLEDLGLVSTRVSGKGVRGHTTLITLGVNKEDVIRIVEKVFVGG